MENTSWLVEGSTPLTASRGQRAFKIENSMRLSQGERFSIRKAPDDDGNLFDAYCIIYLAVHIVTADGNPKQKSRNIGTRRDR